MVGTVFQENKESFWYGFTRALMVQKVRYSSTMEMLLRVRGGPKHASETLSPVCRFIMGTQKH